MILGSATDTRSYKALAPDTKRFPVRKVFLRKGAGHLRYRTAAGKRAAGQRRAFAWFTATKTLGLSLTVCSTPPKARPFPRPSEERGQE